MTRAPLAEGGLELLGLADDDDDLGFAGTLRLERSDLGRRFRVRQQGPAERLAAELRDLLGEVASEPVQFADRDDQGALEVGLQSAEFETRVAETAQLVAERGHVHRTLLGGRAGHRAFAGHDMAFAVVEFDAERLAETADDLGVQGATVVGLLAVPRIMQALASSSWSLVFHRIAPGFTWAHSTSSRPKRMNVRPPRAGSSPWTKPPCSRSAGLPLVEDHAVAGLERAFEAHRHAVRGDVDDRAEVGAAPLAEAGVDEPARCRCRGASPYGGRAKTSSASRNPLPAGPAGPRDRRRRPW
jgi:hypothetical protein